MDGLVYKGSLNARMCVGGAWIRKGGVFVKADGVVSVSKVSSQVIYG